MTPYLRTKFPVCIDRLLKEIEDSAITIALHEQKAQLDGVDQLTVFFKADLPVADEAIFDALVIAHTGDPMPDDYVQKVEMAGIALDAEDAQMVRPKTTTPGWMMALKTFSFVTSGWGSLFGWLDNTRDQDPACALKFYDANNVQITDEANMSQCVRTMASWEPLYNYDIMGAVIEVAEDPTGDFRIVSVAVPDLPKAYGGSKVNIEGGYNLKFLRGGRCLNLDGKTCKSMFYSSTYHTNKVSMNIYHAAGAQLGIQVSMITFRL